MTGLAVRPRLVLPTSLPRPRASGNPRCEQNPGTADARRPGTCEREGRAVGNGTVLALAVSVAVLALIVAGAAIAFTVRTRARGAAEPEQGGEIAAARQHAAEIVRTAEAEAAEIVRKAGLAAEQAGEMRRGLDEEVRAVTVEHKRLR